MRGARVLASFWRRSESATLAGLAGTAWLEASETGATGLEPATSGVTGRFDRETVRQAATVAYTDALGLSLLTVAAASLVGVALGLRFLPARHRPAEVP